MKTILAAGCDAVYVGLAGFSARPASAEFSMDEIKEAVQVCHDSGVKLHVAVNAVVGAGNEGKAREALTALDAAGVDAVILADYPLLSYACRTFQHAAVHASCLLGCLNTPNVQFLKDMGVSCLVFSTNATAEEMAGITSALPTLEYEIVAQGGICFNDNRMCEMAHVMRDGNLLVYCQLDYDLTDGNGKVLSPAKRIGCRHIASQEMIRFYKELGIGTLKIEGRTMPAEEIARKVRLLKDAVQASEALCGKESFPTCSLHYISREKQAGGRQ